MLGLIHFHKIYKRKFLAIDNSIGKIKRSLVSFDGWEKTVDKNGDRLSMNDEKLSYLHKIYKRKFLVNEKNLGLGLYINH